MHILKSGRSRITKLALLAAAVTFLSPLDMVQGEDAPASQDPIAIYVDAGVDKAQEEKIRQLAKQLEDTNGPRAQEIMGLVVLMRQLSVQPDLDEKKILSTQNKINELQAAMSVDRIKLNVKIRQLLTPAQRSKLVTLIQQRRSAPAQQ